jgi:hypothetical protein
MPSTFYLELYRKTIPPALASRPGASRYDPARQNLYWAVLATPEMLDQNVAAFLAPADLDNGAQTHGTDTLSLSLPDYRPFSAGIWRPQTPPYKFIVTAPDGTEVTLDPSTPGDEFTMLQEPLALVSSGLGIWIVRVELKNATALPTATAGSENACLNPQQLPTAANFRKQPLLELSGPQLRPECPEIISFDVASGCAPHATTPVVFRTEIAGNTADLLEISWDFGDGETHAQAGAAQASPILTEHLYATAPTAPATVTIVRQSGCDGLTRTRTAAVPLCESAPNCPTITGVRATGGCAPGRVTFEATFSGDPADVQELAWTFEPDQTPIPQEQPLASPATKSYTYAGAPSDPVVVTLTRRAGCTPLTDTAQLPVPLCIGEPEMVLTCPAITSVRAVAGCAPGEVTFELRFDRAAWDVESIVWTFEEGLPQQATKPQPLITGSPVRMTHSFTAFPQRPVKVKLTRKTGCDPRELTAEAAVPTCGACAELTAAVLVSGCAPGNVVLRAEGTNLPEAHRIEWVFGDNSANGFGPEVPHTYTERREFTARVIVTRAPDCLPQTQEQPVTVPACSDGGGGNGGGGGGSVIPFPRLRFALCALALASAILMIMAGLVIATVGLCSMHDISIVSSGGSPPDQEQSAGDAAAGGNTGGAIVAGVGLGLLISGIALLLIWLLTCGRVRGHCLLLQLAFLFFLYIAPPALSGLAIAMVAGNPSSFCILALLLDLTVPTALAGIIFAVMMEMGCAAPNPLRILRFPRR